MYKVTKTSWNLPNSLNYNCPKVEDLYIILQFNIQFDPKSTNMCCFNPSKCTSIHNDLRKCQHGPKFFTQISFDLANNFIGRRSDLYRQKLSTNKPTQVSLERTKLRISLQFIVKAMLFNSKKTISQKMIIHLYIIKWNEIVYYFTLFILKAP